MTDIARLSVALYANSAQFVSELQKSQKHAQTWGSSVRGAFKVAAGATAAGATAAAGAIALIYAEQSQLIDQTTKLSQSLGMTTESYTQLRYAANLNGAGEVFDSAMESMVIKMGEATFGSGEAKEALDILGLSAAKMGNMTPDQQLLALSDALKNVENQSQKTFITDSIFGGPEMMNLLNQGSESINAMAEEADVLGITLQRIDAAKIEMANDAMYKVGQTTTALNQSLATQLAPFVASLADQFIEYSKQFGGMNNMIATGIHSTTKGVGYLADAFRGIQLIIKSIEVAWYSVVYGMQAGIQELVNLLHGMGNEILKAVTWPILQALDAMSGMSDAAAEMAADIRSTLTAQPLQIFDGVDINNAKMDLNNAIWELQSLASEPLPSDGIEAWYQATKAKFDELAKQYANQVKPLTGGGGNQLSIPDTGGSSDKDSQKVDPAVASFKAANDQIQQQWQRRLAIQQAGDQAEALQENFAYQDKITRLSEHYLKANDAAVNNQALQAELETEYLAARQVLWQEHNANIEQQNLGFWERYGESLQENMMSMDELTSETLNNFANNMGSAFESMIFDSQSIGDAFSNLAEGMARSVVNALGQMAGQWLAYQAVQLLVGKTTATAAASGMAINAQVASMMAGLNAFASTAAIPLVGPAMAPAAMTAALAVTTPIATTIGVLAGGAAGMAHNGISSVPSEGTWLLDKGERVYTNDSANKLDQMYGAVMGGNSSGQSQSSEKQKWVINIYDAPAGTSAEVDDEQKVISIMMKDADSNGQYYNYISSKLGVSAGGYK